MQTPMSIPAVFSNISGLVSFECGFSVNLPIEVYRSAIAVKISDSNNMKHSICIKMDGILYNDEKTVQFIAAMFWYTHLQDMLSPLIFIYPQIGNISDLTRCIAQVSWLEIMLRRSPSLLNFKESIRGAIKHYTQCLRAVLSRDVHALEAEDRCDLMRNLGILIPVSWRDFILLPAQSGYKSEYLKFLRKDKPVVVKYHELTCDGVTGYTGTEIARANVEQFDVVADLWIELTKLKNPQLFKIDTFGSECEDWIKRELPIQDITIVTPRGSFTICDMFYDGFRETLDSISDN